MGTGGRGPGPWRALGAPKASFWGPGAPRAPGALRDPKNGSPRALPKSDLLAGLARLVTKAVQEARGAVG